MKATTIIAVATGLTASLVSAQLEGIPECALACALPILTNSGCDISNIACICGASGFITELLPCVQQSCSAEFIEQTAIGAAALCADAGVTLSIPSSVPTATGSVSSAATEASTTVSSVSVTVTESTLSTVVSSTETVSETEMAETSTPANSTSSPTGTQPPAPTGSDNSSAGRNTIALGGLGAVLAFAAALL